MQKENGSVHLGGEKHAKDAEAAKLEFLVGYSGDSDVPH